MKKASYLQYAAVITIKIKISHKIIAEHQADITCMHIHEQSNSVQGKMSFKFISQSPPLPSSDELEPC